MIEAPPTDPFRILFLGDIVGEPGRKAVMERLAGLKASLGLDFIVVNGENSAGGRGITPKIAIALLRAGVAVITTGDHIWDQKEIVPYLETEPRLLRPLNYPPDTPGQGSIVLETGRGRVAVVNAQGRTFMQPPLENPFLMVAAEVGRLRDEEGARIILVDFHGEATSEKIAMARHLDGTVSAVIGTHTHVQTADERVLPGGTAFLCDAGMCGPHDSVLGRRIESVLARLVTGVPQSMPVARGPVRLCGAVVDVDCSSGKALSIRRFRDDVAADSGLSEAEEFTLGE